MPLLVPGTDLSASRPSLLWHECHGTWALNVFFYYFEHGWKQVDGVSGVPFAYLRIVPKTEGRHFCDLGACSVFYNSWNWTLQKSWNITKRMYMPKGIANETPTIYLFSLLVSKKLSYMYPPLLKPLLPSVPVGSRSEESSVETQGALNIRLDFFETEPYTCWAVVHPNESQTYHL